MYSRMRVMGDVRAVLSDPAFSAERASDVDRLIDAVPRQRTRGMGQERDQLFATLDACVDVPALYERLSLQTAKGFLSADALRGKSVAALLAAQGRLDMEPLSLAGERWDVVDALAKRIYTLRSRIVHAKESEGAEPAPLLAVSEEAFQLGPDVELIHAVARDVLLASESTTSISVATSGSLRLPDGRQAS
jgi:hypothetical protein